MSTRRTAQHALSVLVAGGAALLIFGAPASAADAPPAPDKGDPLAGPDFFAGHLERYHFGHTILGFDRALSDPYDWGVYHFVPTNVETAARAVSPAHAPEAPGDTWVDTPAPEAGPGHGHGPPSHEGHALRAPVNPIAGVEYLSKWARQPAPEEAVPAAQEAARRTVTPVEDHPPNTVDEWSDKRPADGGHSAPTVLPAEVAAVPAQASTTAGRYTAGVLDTIGGDSPNHEPLLPVGGLLPPGH